MSTVTTSRSPSTTAGVAAATTALAFGLAAPLAIVGGLLAALVGSRQITRIVETDGTVLEFDGDSVTIILPDGTSASYTLQDMADAAAAANAYPQGVSTASQPSGAASSDDAELLADAVRIGASLLG